MFVFELLVREFPLPAIVSRFELRCQSRAGDALHLFHSHVMEILENFLILLRNEISDHGFGFSTLSLA